MARPATATPERILHAASSRFSRYGFRRTSMEDIAGLRAGQARERAVRAGCMASAALRAAMTGPGGRSHF